MNTMFPVERTGAWDADRIMAERFLSDCLLFDLADRGRLVATRCPAVRRNRGKELADFLDVSALSELRQALHEYDLRPLDVETAYGPGTLVLSLAPASALGVLLLWEDGHGTEEAATSREPYAFLCQGLSLRERICHWARLTGCPVSVFLEEEEEPEEDFDAELFDTILWILLLLCRRISRSRTATLYLEQRSHGVAVSWQTPLRKASGDIEDAEELSFLRTLADRRRIPLDYTVLDGILYLSFHPVRHDWSYLDIKQPEMMSWLMEEKEQKETIPLLGQTE